MAAPEYVPKRGDDRTRYYESPPRRPDSWVPARPGELDAYQPEGLGFGVQGPDQGFALRIVGHFAEKVRLTEGERWDDVRAGAVQIGLKRASLYSRAPVAHDIEIGLRLFGFLDEAPDEALVALRRRLFEGLAHHHHYMEMRQLVAMVPEATLRSTPAAVAAEHGRDWRSLLDLSVVAAADDHAHS